MKIDRALNGADLLGETLFISNTLYEQPKNIVATTRIGVHYAKEWADELLRFYIQGNAFISQR